MASNREHLLSLPVISAFFIMLAYLCSPVAADCFWPDGSDAYDMHECYSTAGADGLCCAEGDLCLLNHLCQAAGTTSALYRGACNMPDWTQASTCPQVCDDPKTGSNSTAAQPVGECGTNDGEYFCSTGDTDCSDYGPTDLFTLSGKLPWHSAREEIVLLTAAQDAHRSTTPQAA